MDVGEVEESVVDVEISETVDDMKDAVPTSSSIASSDEGTPDLEKKKTLIGIPIQANNTYLVLARVTRLGKGGCFVAFFFFFFCVGAFFAADFFPSLGNAFA